MTRRDDYGYLTNPTNGLGIVRSRTLIGNLRLWDIPRSEQALDAIIDEIGQSPIPGLYMLFDERSEKKVYIGQTENKKKRLINHMNNPENKIKNWDRAIIITDGRNASQSDLNDENIRLVLENYLVKLFQINKYKVVTLSSRDPSLSSAQRTLCNSFKDEIIILLTHKRKISREIMDRADDEVYIDEARRILERKGHAIRKWGRLDAVVDGSKTFVRAGSKKPNGWQVTFRGGKTDSFKTRLAAGKGQLLMPRGPVLLIPLCNVRGFISSVDRNAFNRDTIDIFIRFDETNIFLTYKGNDLEVTKYAVQDYPNN